MRGFLGKNSTFRKPLTERQIIGHQDVGASSNDRVLQLTPLRVLC